MPTAKVPVSINFRQELYDAIHQAALARGIGRATFIRNCVEKELKYVAKTGSHKTPAKQPWEIPDAAEGLDE